MPKILTQAQVDQYKRDGFAFPAPVLTPDEVRWMRADLESWEAQAGPSARLPGEEQVVPALCAGPTRWFTIRKCSTRSRT